MHYIYRITNILNQKVYIGQSKNPKLRWSDHKYHALKQNPVQYIHRAMIKYGIDNFEFEIIAQSVLKQDVDYTEEIIITQYKSTEKEFGYNLKSGGNGTTHSDETKQKLSEQKTTFYSERLIETGSKMTKEERLKLSNSHKGLKYPTRKDKGKILPSRIPYDNQIIIINLVLNGFSDSKISEKTGHSKASVRKIRVDNNLKTNFKNAGINFSDDVKKEIISKVLSGNYTLKFLCQEYNCSWAKLKRLIKKDLINE